MNNSKAFIFCVFIIFLKFNHLLSLSIKSSNETKLIDSPILAGNFNSTGLTGVVNTVGSCNNANEDDLAYFQQIHVGANKDVSLSATISNSRGNIYCVAVVGSNLNINVVVSGSSATIQLTASNSGGSDAIIHLYGN